MNPVSAARPNTDLQELRDEELMEVLVAGNKAAFDVLVHRHKARLYSYLLRLLRDPSDAEEVTQETLVRAYVHAAKYRNIAKFSSWLFSIASNLARDEARAAIRRRRHLTLLKDEADFPARDDPAEELEARERRDAVRRALDALGERDREALLLWDAGLDYTEIAKQTGLSIGSVGTTLARARKRLVEAHVALEVQHATRG